MVQMMTKVLHVNQQHKFHGVDDDTLHVNQQHILHGVDDDKGTSCKSTLHVNHNTLHGVDDDKGTSCKSTTQIAWCR